ncbi:MAG: CDP-alcohol phosphatidyltransferase family protein [Alphaproteobacteria bacterium]|nr:CDP-alcohol phosphatidyltransferase family protein [Alphaproteobacteria bacterium]
MLANFRPYFWIPQALTGLRLLAGPFVLWALLANHATLAFWLVCFASLTDWLDGASARFLGIESEFGRTFDPIADKVFVTCVCVGLFVIGKLPFWLISIVVFRDLLIVLGGLWIKKKKIPYTLNPIRISKYNTGLQMSLVGWLLLIPLLPPLNFYPLFSSALIYGTLATTLLSGFVYAKIFVHFYRASKFFQVVPGNHTHCSDQCRHHSQP